MVGTFCFFESVLSKKVLYTGGVPKIERSCAFIFWKKRKKKNPIQKDKLVNRLISYKKKIGTTAGHFQMLFGSNMNLSRTHANHFQSVSFYAHRFDLSEVDKRLITILSTLRMKGIALFLNPFVKSN
jgi:hypothetical protein